MPILKPDKEAHDVGSYRPLSLTSHLGKTLETIVNKRIQTHLEKYNSYSPNQVGFRKHRSTVDQLIKLEHEVKSGFQRNEKTVAIFLDVARAYDECWREGALHKIKKMGISGRTFNYIENFLSDRYFSSSTQL